MNANTICPALDGNLFKQCNLEVFEETKPEASFEYLPCQKKFRLEPEDEISLDSIFSSLLARIEPSEEQFRHLKFDVTAKELLNEKQSMLFEEKLYISRLKNTNCKFDDEHKIFLDRELEMVGEYTLNIEESYDGYVVFSKSFMKKDKSENRSGHSLRGKYDNRFLLICEKRMEYDYVDNVRVEKSLEARNKDDKKLEVIRATKISEEVQRFKANINIYGRTDIFLLDGGITLFMRYLIINNFRGERSYFTMNLFGKVLQCVLSIREERKRVRIFNQTFDNTICIYNTQYFDGVPQETSETYFTSNGRIVLHFWHGFNYLLHCARAPSKPQERLIPKMELMWRSDNLLVKKYEMDKKLNYESAARYLEEHPEMIDFINDYVQGLLKYKPQNVLEFTVRYFQNMKNSF